MIPSDLRDELGYARSLDVDKLASDIGKIGFECNNCGACCTQQDEVDEAGWADNAVVVYPFEIRRIMGVAGLSWLEVAAPPASCEVDDKGRVHTFEWHLRQKCIGGPRGVKGSEGQTCRFLNQKRCTIYEYRPFLCRTYPFYMSDRRLCVGPCEGVGVSISKTKCLELAHVIKERYIEDLNQMILLLDRFEPYVPRGDGDEGGNSKSNNKSDSYRCQDGTSKGSGKPIEYIVHDSEGAHQISIQQE